MLSLKSFHVLSLLLTAVRAALHANPAERPFLGDYKDRPERAVTGMADQNPAEQPLPEGFSDLPRAVTDMAIKHQQNPPAARATFPRTHAFLKNTSKVTFFMACWTYVLRNVVRRNGFYFQLSLQLAAALWATTTANLQSVGVGVGAAMVLREKLLLQKSGTLRMIFAYLLTLQLIGGTLSGVHEILALVQPLLRASPCFSSLVRGLERRGSSLARKVERKLFGIQAKESGTGTSLLVEDKRDFQSASFLNKLRHRLCTVGRGLSELTVLIPIVLPVLLEKYLDRWVPTNKHSEELKVEASEQQHYKIFLHGNGVNAGQWLLGRTSQGLRGETENILYVNYFKGPIAIKEDGNVDQLMDKILPNLVESMEKVLLASTHKPVEFSFVGHSLGGDLVVELLRRLEAFSIGPSAGVPSERSSLSRVYQMLASNEIRFRHIVIML